MIPLAKGSSLLDLVKLARKNRASFAKALPPETLAFIETRVLVGSWYPEVHLRNLLLAADKALGRGDLALCWTLGALAAKDQLRSVYKAAWIPGDVPGTLSQFGVFWSLFHNTGAADLEAVSPGYVRLRIRDFALPNRPLCACNGGWVQGLLRLTEVQGEVTEEQCRTRGDDACVYGVRWA